MTSERSAAFARALTLTRPQSRRRLYWTARSVFVQDRAHAAAFDAVFAAVFGGEPAADALELDARQVTPAPADARPAGERGGPSRR